MAMSSSNIPSFPAALHSDSPAPDRAANMGLYAWLIGSWEMDVAIYNTDGTTRSSQGIIAAGWVLQGRAVQDIFAVPGLFYGTTLRVYDPDHDVWHISWTDPVNQVYLTQTACAKGDEIIQEGEETASAARLYATGDGDQVAARLRWIFSDITPNSFRWRSERSTDHTHWRLQREYFVKRV